MEPMIPGTGGHDFSPRTGSAPGFVRQMLARLQESEWCLVELMVAAGVWTAPPPAPPTAKGAKGRDVEWGTALFLLNHTHLIADATTRLLAEAFEALLVLVGVKLPPSLLPPSQYAILDANKLVAPSDGSLLGTGPYELYDQRWISAFFNLVRSIVEGRIFDDGELPVPLTPDPTLVATPRQGRVTLALVSDWGTGEPAAGAVIGTLAGLDPDLVVHLGDVYYSGTPADGPFAPKGEEQANLVAPWPAVLAGRSFTLNSNHEMYSGALGYFAALGNDAAPFAAQRGCSMFALRIGDWTVLGLDSAYYADPLELYMFGSLALPAATQQMDWIASLDLEPSKVIVLTHHNALDVACDPAQQSSYTPFWTQLRTALGGDPAAWYWGHIHNGIVYASPLTVGTSFVTNTRCRCLGHGALPYGLAAALADTPQIAWHATTPAGIGAELLNGFVTLCFDLDANGNVAAITEAFHDSGNTGPVYRAAIPA